METDEKGNFNIHFTFSIELKIAEFHNSNEIVISLPILYSSAPQTTKIPTQQQIQSIIHIVQYKNRSHYFPDGLN